LDASAFEDVISDEDDWQQWPILSTDGDVAALIQLVSEDKVR
jgi:oxalate---CoA ligase